MKHFLLKKLHFFIFIVPFITFAQEKNIEIEGTVIDETNITIPYASVSIVKKSIGTSSTDDGEFSLLISKNELQDTLSIISLGYKTFKIKIQDFISQEEKKILLKEDVADLDEVVLLKPKEYITKAFDKLKENTISTSHKLEMLFRRAVTEGGKAKFFVENYIKIKDKGPGYNFGTVQVTESRKSADYRVWKGKQAQHSVTYMGWSNPLRPDKRYLLKKLIWKKVGDSSYEGEDVVIIKGYPKGREYDYFKLYIGLENYGVYKIETRNAIYVYKKHKSGKLHLNYYSKEWIFPKKSLPEKYRNTKIGSVTYRSESFVYNVETNKKKFKVRGYGGDLDMGSLDLRYHPLFWRNLSSPPDTKFFKKIKSEIEGIYGVSLEKQYLYSNKIK